MDYAPKHRKRRILHVDMDAFFASVEQADRPELKGRPVIVGASRRGVVCAASYEARVYGVRSAMPVFQAVKLCPDGVFLPVRKERYGEVSERIMDIFREISPLVEQVSIDEAFIDATGTETIHGPAEQLAATLKNTVFDTTGLTCSVGIAPVKFLAKIASELQKPNGLSVLHEEDVPGFLARLPVEKLPGVGCKTVEIFRRLGVETVSDILRYPLAFWIDRIGKPGVRLYEAAQGIDRSNVSPSSQCKSCSSEDTFPEDTSDIHELEKWLAAQSEMIGRDLRKNGLRGRTVTLKVKFSDFRTVTRSRTIQEATHCTEVIFATAKHLLEELRIGSKVRLVGVGVSNLTGGPIQAKLFSAGRTEKFEHLDKAMDAVHGKFGAAALLRGRLFPDK